MLGTSICDLSPNSPPLKSRFRDPFVEDHARGDEVMRSKKLAGGKGFHWLDTPNINVSRAGKSGEKIVPKFKSYGETHEMR